MSRRPPISPLFPSTTLFRSPLSSSDSESLVHPSEYLDRRTRRVAALTHYGSGDARMGNLVRWVIGMSMIKHRSEEHTSELQSRQYLVCRLLLEKKKKKTPPRRHVPFKPLIQPLHLL